MTILLPKNHVLTPCGPRHKDNVHHIESGYELRVEHDRLKKIHVDSGKVTEFPAARDLKPELPTTSGWNAYSGWTNTGTMFSGFSSSWTVPASPVDPSQGQTIFLFPGIQNSSGAVGILQPVLQWGPSAAGGGSYWAIANWWVLSGAGHAAHSSLITVDPGGDLTGIMSVLSGSGNSYTYKSAFAGYASIDLTVQNLPPLVWFNETLESYGVEDCQGYPPQIVPVKFRGIDISLNDGSNPASIPWSTHRGSSTVCSEHAQIVDTSATSGEVDVYFGQWPSGQVINDVDSTSLGLAACNFNGALYVFWKGQSNDSIYYSASSDGASWPSGRTLNGTDSTVDALACCVFDDKLYLFWKGKSNDNIYFSASSDGVTWPSGQTINGTDSTVDAPSCCVFDDELYLFWKGKSNNSIYFSASSDGATWPSGRTINGTDSTTMSPSCCVYSDLLYVFWKGKSNNSIYFSPLESGTSWPPGQTINGTDSTPQPIACDVFSDRLYLFWTANDSSHRIYFTD